MFINFAGAAPTFFPSFEGFLDGGLVSNNPTFDGITEILEVNAALKKKGREGEASDLSHVVCFGTGISPAVNLDDIEVRWPGSLLDLVGAGNGKFLLLNFICSHSFKNISSSFSRFQQPP